MGHPSPEVQALAKKLEPELCAATTHSRHHVSDVLGARNTPEQLQLAQESHEAEAATADELDRAVKRAGGTSSPGSAEPPAAQPLPAVKVR